MEPIDVESFLFQKLVVVALVVAELLLFVDEEIEKEQTPAV